MWGNFPMARAQPRHLGLQGGVAECSKFRVERGVFLTWDEVLVFGKKGGNLVQSCQKGYILINKILVFSAGGNYELLMTDIT